MLWICHLTNFRTGPPNSSSEQETGTTLNYAPQLRVVPFTNSEAKSGTGPITQGARRILFSRFSPAFVFTLGVNSGEHVHLSVRRFDAIHGQAVDA
jgi:hypothetical protein